MTVTRKNEQMFQLQDNVTQLELFYLGKAKIICKMASSKLANFDTAYLKVTALNWSPIYNEAIKLCLGTNLCWNYMFNHAANR